MSQPYVIGYARTSTRQQDLTLQREALEKAGCNRIFEEQESGAKRDRPILKQALDTLRPGDTFMVWKIDRLARSLSHLISVAEDLEKSGIHFASLTESFDTRTPAGRAFFQMCGVMGELERSLIEERRLAGIAKARAAGKKFGRKPLSDPGAKGGKPGSLAQAILAVHRGVSIRSAAMAHGISRTTLRRHLDSQNGPGNLVIFSRPANEEKRRSASAL